MSRVTIDRDLCNGCGECAKDCLWSLFTVEDKKARFNEQKADMCNGCQHCLAVCKAGAVSVDGIGPAMVTPLGDNRPTLEQMEVLVGGRRTVRRYKDEPVERELLDRVLAATANAPTGRNAMQTALTVVDDIAVMNALREACYEALEKVLDEDRLPESMAFFKEYMKLRKEKGLDPLFRGAPHFVVASVTATAPTPMPDCLIALSYFELLAQSAGLGTVWAGLVHWLLTEIAPEATALLNLPEGHQLGYCMAFGKPAVRYHRTVQRKGAVVRRLARD